MSQPKYYGLNELREMFLHFFETKGHLRLPSFSLIPQNDAVRRLFQDRVHPLGVGIPDEPRVGRPRPEPPVSLCFRRQRDHTRR